MISFGFILSILSILVNFFVRNSEGGAALYIEAEMHHVAFLHDVLFAFQSE